MAEGERRQNSTCRDLPGHPGAAAAQAADPGGPRELESDWESVEMLECETNPKEQRPRRWFLVSGILSAQPVACRERSSVRVSLGTAWFPVTPSACSGRDLGVGDPSTPVFSECFPPWMWKVASCHPSPRSAPAQQGCDKSGCAEGLTQRQSRSAESPASPRTPRHPECRGIGLSQAGLRREGEEGCPRNGGREKVSFNRPISWEELFTV